MVDAKWSSKGAGRESAPVLKAVVLGVLDLLEALVTAKGEGNKEAREKRAIPKHTNDLVNEGKDDDAQEGGEREGEDGHPEELSRTMNAATGKRNRGTWKHFATLC